MNENLSRFTTIEGLINYLNIDNDKPIVKEVMHDKIKLVLSLKDNIYTFSTEKNKDLLLFLLVMTVKYYCLFIEEYELSYSLWRQRIDDIYNKYLNDNRSILNEVTLSLLETEMVCASRLNKLDNPLKQMIKKIDVANLKIPECHNLYTNFLFLNEHFEAYGFFIKRLIETEDLDNEQVLSYICPFFSSCLSNFQSHSNITYYNIVDDIKSALEKNNFSKIIISITDFYRITFAVLYKQSIINNDSPPNDDNEEEENNNYDSEIEIYSEDSIYHAFKSLFYNIDEDLLIKYKNLVENLLHDYFDHIFSYFAKNPFDIIAELKNTVLPQYKNNLLDNYLCRHLNSSLGTYFSNKDYVAISKVYRNISDHTEGKKKLLDKFYLEIAYSIHETGDMEAAKKIYEYALNRGFHNPNLYTNLGNIYLEERKYEKALALYNRALGIDPDNKSTMYGKESAQREIRKVKQKEDRLRETYTKKIKRFHKALLFTIYNRSDRNVPARVLSKIIGQEEKSVKETINYLITLELLTIGHNGEYLINPVIEKLIDEYVKPNQSISPAANDGFMLYKPLISNDYDIYIYNILKELFIGYTISTNISLKAILKIENLHEFFDDNIIDYLNQSFAEFVIVDNSTFLPMLVLEKENMENCSQGIQKDSDIKASVFGICRIPYTSILLDKDMDKEQIKDKLRASIKELILQNKAEDNYYILNFIQDIDLEELGIFNSPYNIEIIQNEWCSLVGETIAEKSIIKGVENGVLNIQISEAIKPIMEISSDNLKNTLLNRFLFLQDVLFTWI